MAVRRVASAPNAISRLQGIIKEAVHVKIHPRPRNLAESREILRILQRYGEVAMYKHLKYESVAPAQNTAIAIYQSAASAQKLIDASPIRFVLQDGKSDLSPLRGSPAGSAEGGRDAEERPQTRTRPQKNQAIDDGSHVASDEGHAGDTAFHGLGGSTKWGTGFTGLNLQESNSPTDPSVGLQSETLTSNPLPAQAPDILSQIPVPPSSATTFDPPPPGPPREYQLTITPSNMNHAAYIERQGYYGGFNPDNGSIMAEDLEGRVPLQGLIDCQIRRMEAPARVVAKWKDKAAQKKTTLKELWENGKKERGE